MLEDLLETVRKALEARKGEWPQIAAALSPDVSYSFISKLGRGQYKSEPSYKTLKLLHDYLAPEGTEA